jgi:uncharacterized protein YqhQ
MGRYLSDRPERINMKRHIGQDQPEKHKHVRSLQKKTTIGGQALIEGLMMIGPQKKAIAVRKPDGSIVLEELPMTLFTGAATWPFIRGSIRLFRQLVSGTKALLRSAEFFEEEELPAQTDLAETANTAKVTSAPPRKSKLDLYMAKHSDQVLYFSAAIGILFSIGLFILLPNFITSFIGPLLGLNEMKSAGNKILLNLIEGFIRIIIFLGYLLLASRMKDIKRVWMYHGAEHKAIACYEARQDLTVENVRVFSRFHSRCGTAFLFIVIIVSIIVFSFVGWWGRWLNLLIRFALVPVIAGIAYEIIRLAGRYDNWLTRLVSAPGLLLQHLTTAEPDDSMLEVAIVALEAVIPAEQQNDNW